MKREENPVKVISERESERKEKSIKKPRKKMGLNWTKKLNKILIETNGKIRKGSVRVRERIRKGDTRKLASESETREKLN